MQTPQTTTIEINGVKLEVDLRTAKRVDTMRVGTRVKLLKKEYSSHKVLHGVIVGFEPFTKLPTIIVAAVLVEYSSAKIEFFYVNDELKDVELVVALDDDFAAVDKVNFLKLVDKEIKTKQNEITELENRRQYFLDKFQQYWAPLEKAVADASEGVSFE